MGKKHVNVRGIVVALVIAGAAAWFALPLVVAQSEPPRADTPQGEVTERAVPGLAIPRPGVGLPSAPPPAPSQSPAVPSGKLPPTLGGPIQPGTTPGVTGLGSGIDAANALLALPWKGLSKQREEDAERNIRESLEDKRIAHGGAHISLKGSSVARWDFSLQITNVGANLDFAAPPGFRTASLNGFVMEAPLGRSWNVAVRGQVKGRASVTAGGEDVLTWSPSLFPFGLRITDIQLIADARFDPSDPARPRLVSAVIRPHFAVGGEGSLPVSIPISLKSQLAGGKLQLIGSMTSLPLDLGPLDGKFTGDLIMIFEPRRYDVGAEMDLSTEIFGVPQGDDVNIGAAFQQVTLTFQGKLSVRFKFKFLGEGYDKRVEVPLELSFPFAVPTTDEFNMLIVGLQPGLPRIYGENPPIVTPPPVQPPVDLAVAANEIETGIIPHLPAGTVLTLDYPWLPLDPPVGKIPALGGLSGGKTAPPTYGTVADSAIWTAHYLAAESFRYAAMPSPAALERVKFVLDGIKHLFEVTGDAVGPPVRQGIPGGIIGGAAFIPVTVGPGILSRTVRRSDNPINYTSGGLETQPCYYLQSQGGWRIQGNPTTFPTYGAVPEATRKGLPQLIQPVGPLWYGWGCGTNHPVSRDQYVGVFMGLAMAYQNVNDPAVRATAGKLIEDALDYLLRNNWNVILPPDNRIVPTSSYFGDFPKQLAYLRIGKTVNPAKYGPIYDRYAPAAELAWIPIWFSSIDPLFQYYKFNLSHAAYSPLLFLETDPSIRAKAMVGYNMLWRAIRHHKNAYFDLLHILVQAPADRAAMAADPAPATPGVSLANEIQSLLNEWLIRRNRIMGPNGLPRNDVAYWEYQRDLWPRGVSLYAALGGKPKWISNNALPIWGRIGRGMDFMWQRDPFQVGMDEGMRRPGAPPPDQMEILRNGAQGIHRLREGAAVDYLLAYYLAVYLGVIPK
jgi:hypothetical protein